LQYWTTPEKKENVIQTGVSIVKQFISGSKQLWKNFKLVRQLQQKGQNLNRNEWIFVEKTKNDIKKSIPILLLFWLPVVGNLVPLIVIFVPSLLPSMFVIERFLIAAQKKKEEQQSLAAKEVIDQLETFNVFDLSKKTSITKNIQNKNLVPISDIETLSRLMDSQLQLNRISKSHIMSLRQFMSLSYVLPTRGFLENQLLKRLRFIIEDDKMLGSEDLHSYSEKDIRDALNDRGVPSQNLSKEEMVKKLQDWVSFSVPHQQFPLLLLHVLCVENNGQANYLISKTRKQK